MKRINTIILPLLAAAALSSCSKQAAPDSNFPEDRVIRVEASVLPSTKGSYTSDDLNEFGLTVKNISYTANDSYNFKNIVFAKTDGSWAPQGTTPLWRNAQDEVILVATVPEHPSSDPNSSISSYPGHKFTIQTVQTKEDNSSDVLGWYKKGVPESFLVNGKVNIEFQHLMSKLNLTFVLATEFNFSGIPENDIVSNVVIKGTYSEVYINYDSTYDRFGYHSAYSPKDISAYSTGWTKAESKDKHCSSKWECILVPNTSPTSITISFDVNGKPYICTLSGKTLEQGKAHNLTINVGKDVATVGPLTIAGWVESDSHSNLETE